VHGRTYLFEAIVLENLESAVNANILVRDPTEQNEVDLLDIQNADNMLRLRLRLHGDVYTGNDPLEQVVVSMFYRSAFRSFFCMA
jgi:hypothetical protein